MPPITIVYATSSSHKREEIEIFHSVGYLDDGTIVRDSFTFDIRPIQIQEVLEVDLGVMVRAEVVKAYSQLRVPCIVEHAGLIFDDYHDKSYPGGLTKPMWNTLGDRFVQETGSSGRCVIARAVIAYCDGKRVFTFDGETHGTIADSPRGSRDFYWDTVFIPDNANGEPGSMTYAEIVESSPLGLPHKVNNLSQSSKAMRKFLVYRKTNEPGLWSMV